MIERRTVSNYFDLLEDLLLSVRISPFAKRSARRLTMHPKFYFFDTGIYRTIRPKGPLDSPGEIGGVSLESLVFQELRAVVDYAGRGDRIHYWHTASGREVDFIVYGPNTFRGIEVKQSGTVRRSDLSGLAAFKSDYPEARLYLLYGGDHREYHDGIEVIPVTEALRVLPSIIYPDID
jgi:predicted AAA+ superfamily ATPase